MIQKLCDSVMNNQLGWQEKPAQEITAFGADGSKSLTEFSGLNLELYSGSGECQGGDTTNTAKLSTQQVTHKNNS